MTRLAQIGLVAGLVVALFVSAYARQGLAGWPDLVAASLVNLVPPAALGVVAWRFAVRAGGARWPWPVMIAAHGTAALAYAGAWTATVAILVKWLQPGAAANFEGAATWHFVGGVMLYGLIAGLAHAAGLARQLKARELAAARAELLALRAQLDPHFLFNTLHSIGALVREDPAAAELAIERFGDLMRYVLNAGRGGLVALDDELAFVRGYLALEAMRLGDRLTVRLAVDEPALEAGVPPLVLQPLVENAVRHGLSPLHAGGTVTVTGGLEGDRLWLSVVDDGVGASGRAPSTAAGVGLTVTRRQLDAHFGGAATLTIETAPGCGYAVHLQTPLVAPRTR